MIAPIRSVPALSVIELTDVILSEGLASQRELENLSLTFYQLKNEKKYFSSLANERVPEYELIAIWNYVVNSLKRPDIGLLVSKKINTQYRGPLAKLILHSESIGHALEIFLLRQKWANPGDNWSFSDCIENEKTVTLRYQNDKLMEYPHAFIERSMSMMIGWFSVMSGQTILPVEVKFNYKCPPHYAQYLPIFGDHCKFESIENSLTIARQVLDLKNVNSDPYLFKLLLANHDKLMNNYYSQFQIDVRIKQEILSSLPATLTIEELSKKLNMSRSSLYRRLKENSTSYSKLLRNIRMELAQSQLSDGNTVTQVAYSLGFADASAFQKWFKSSFTHPPSVLREKWTSAKSSK